MNDNDKPGRRWLVALIVLLLLFLGTPLIAGTYDLLIEEDSVELRPGLNTNVWAYNGSVPGPQLIVKPGERVVVKVTNRLKVATNIHWHGLQIPNDQDGPAILIDPGASFTYDFVVEEAGTFWYHSHHRPVLEQLDMGLYGAFIVQEPNDDRYSGDHVLILDDWYFDANGARLSGTGRGVMERLGNIETVNGKTGAAVQPLLFTQGELHKLRFLNASTAATHTLSITGHSFRVTHTDGRPLLEPYTTDLIILSPGERIDAEIAATADPGTASEIRSNRPDFGIRIPITYASGRVATVASPYVPPSTRGFPGIFERAPDHLLILNSVMGKLGAGKEEMEEMGMMGGDAAGEAGSVWTINGKTFPDTEPLQLKVGELSKLRIRNDDKDMSHPMDHPIHLHGTFFQVVAIDGQKPEREIWKDTFTVPSGKTVDIAFVMKRPGDWLLHCHVIDHEDGRHDDHRPGPPLTLTALTRARTCCSFAVPSRVGVRTRICRYPLRKEHHLREGPR